ncbi:MAG: type II toxin-antitoxin system Phd/YefM family antitoxin [Clostridiales Family XIII bacterium]|jgi:prevent-host-death family protein|nr:type II toxin-antitoxin system Phd/YefM family antitoxin [Clostridiales Family XIII bacterium]
MPKIIPIKDLKDTAQVSSMVRESAGPVYVTKNGYEDMVLLSTEEYDRLLYTMDMLEKLAEGERAIRRGETVDAFKSVAAIRRRYDL